jgi:hypothetical protein
VPTSPGTTVLTVICWLARSWARYPVAWFIAALFRPCVSAGAHTTVDAVPLMLMMRPVPSAGMSGRNAWMTRSDPISLPSEVADPIGIGPEDLPVRAADRVAGIVDDDVDVAEGRSRRVGGRLPPTRCG